MRKDRIKIQMVDDQGHFYIGDKLYKLKGMRRGSGSGLRQTFEGMFVEVNPKEYDERIEGLTRRILSYPNVDVADIIRDALYDLNLDWLDRLEKRLDQEDQRAKEKGEQPKVETKRGDRGTCVELHIGGRYAAQLRV